MRLSRFYLMKILASVQLPFKQHCFVFSSVPPAPSKWRPPALVQLPFNQRSFHPSIPLLVDKEFVHQSRFYFNLVQENLLSWTFCCKRFVVNLLLWTFFRKHFVVNVLSWTFCRERFVREPFVVEPFNTRLARTKSASYFKHVGPTEAILKADYTTTNINCFWK